MIRENRCLDDLLGDKERASKDPNLFLFEQELIKGLLTETAFRKLIWHRQTCDQTKHTAVKDLEITDPM